MKTINAKQLEKSYHGRKVVKNVSLQLNQGEVVGLLGPNGAGKTTTFYMILGLVKPTVGHIELDNEDMTKLPIETRAKLGLGYLPQEPSIFRKMNVEENILSIAQLNPNLNKTQQSEKVTQLLDTFHLTHLKKHIASSLSGGERRRLEIARVLAMEPSFILLDEPFAGVDPISVNDIMKLIQYLASQQIGILITDHNVRETLKICHRAYIINEGEVLCQGNSDAIVQNEQVRRCYLGETFEL